MSQWPLFPLGSKVRFFSGGTPSKDEPKYWRGTISWVSSAEMTQRRISDTKLHVTEDGVAAGSKLVPRRTVLVVVRGMSLAKEFRVAITMREMAFNQDLKAILPAKDLDPNYLFYYLLSQNNAIRDSTSEAAHGTKKLDMPVLEQWPLALPPMPYQLKFASILSAYDDLIENNRRRIALLERMAEQLYREWFVRFRFPGYQHAKFEKGVPRDWTKARFSDLCTLQRGFDLPDAQIVDGSYPVVASTSIKAFHHAFKVDPPVITTGRSGSLGDVLWTNERAWPLNTALYVRDFCGNSPYFVFHTLSTMRLENFNSGAGVPSLNRNHLKSLPISLPPKPLQDAFANQVGPMQSLKEKLERACIELAKTRDLLLPRLISGKLRVDDLDIQFPPSMQAERA